MSTFTEFTVQASTLQRDHISVVEIVRQALLEKDVEFIFDSISSTFVDATVQITICGRLCAESLFAVRVLEHMYKRLKAKNIQFEINVHRLDLY